MSRLPSSLARLVPDRVPPLRGWWLNAYTLLFVLTFAMAIGMTGVGIWKGIQPFEYGWANYGLTASTDSQRVIAVTGEEASEQGIARDDEIIAVGAVPIGRLAGSWAATKDALARPEGGTLELTLRHANGEVRTHELTRRASNVEPFAKLRQIRNLSEWLASAATLIAALLLFRRRREAVPAILALAFAGQQAAGGMDANLWLEQYWLTERVGVVSLALLPLGLLLFPDGRIGSLGSLMIACAIGCYALWLLADTAALGHIAALPTLLILIALSLLRLAQRYRRLPPGVLRQQIRWGIFGLSIGGMLLLASGLCYVASTQLAGSWFFDLQNAASIIYTLALLCMVGGLIISLMRYRLYDADAVIGRSAAYGVLSLGFIALFAGSQELLEGLGETLLGGQIGAVASGLGASIAAVMIVPLHGRVNRWAERRFQKDVVRLRKGLPELVGDLRETASVTRISEVVANGAASGVRATRAAVIVEGEVVATRGVDEAAVRDWAAARDIAAEPVKAARSDPQFPMRLPLETESMDRIGWLVLGPRPDGSFYGRDEREALADIAEPVARAIDIARTRERREAETRDAMHKMFGMLKIMDSRIRALEAT